jgi:hypothetical protein
MEHEFIEKSVSKRMSLAERESSVINNSEQKLFATIESCLVSSISNQASLIIIIITIIISKIISQKPSSGIQLFKLHCCFPSSPLPFDLKTSIRVKSKFFRISSCLSFVYSKKSSTFKRESRGAAR